LFPNGIENPKEIDKNLQNINGVIDTGLFINMATKIIIGNNEGSRILE